MWASKKKLIKDKNDVISVSKKLRREERSSEEFEIVLSGLTLEEVIGLKLELSSKPFTNNKFYGFPIWNSLSFIIKESLLMFALNNTTSKRSAARVLGISELRLEKIIKMLDFKEN